MKKFFIAVIGGTAVLTGLVMLFLPGPGLLVLAGGFAILATEFVWARRAMRRAKGTAARVRRKSGLAAWLRRRRVTASTKAAAVAPERTTGK